MSAENPPNGSALLHVAYCIAAINSIGGDPATVAELVAALRAIDAASPAWTQDGFISGLLDAILAARAVLAKLPNKETPND